MKKAVAFLCLLLTAVGLCLAQLALPGPITNDTVTGSTLNKLVKYNATAGAPSVIITATTDTSGALGICGDGCGTSGKSAIITIGQASCVFENATTVNDLVVIGSSTAGDCHDSGVSAPSGCASITGQVVGTVFQAGGSAGTYKISLRNPCAPGSAVTVPFVEIGNGGAANGFTVTSNLTFLFPFVPKGSFTTTQLEYNVQTADNTADLYDLGIYNSSGTLLGHTGATAGTTISPSTGNKTISWLSSFSLTGGNLYFLAMTGNAVTFKLGGSGSFVSLYCGVQPSASSATTAGVLNSSVTIPAGTNSAVCNFPAAVAW